MSSSNATGERGPSAEASFDTAAFASGMASYHVADIVETLNGLTPPMVAGVIESLPFNRATDVLE
jgi:hypothetical protein